MERERWGFIGLEISFISLAGCRYSLRYYLCFSGDEQRKSRDISVNIHINLSVSSFDVSFTDNSFSITFPVVGYLIIELPNLFPCTNCRSLGKLDSHTEQFEIGTSEDWLTSNRKIKINE